MHKLGRLERCPLKFAPQTRGGANPKFTVNQRHKLVPRRQIAIAPGAEQRGHVVARRRGHARILGLAPKPVKEASDPGRSA